MIDKIAFLFSEGLKNFLRNKLTNFLCIITILINFTILGTFFVVGFNTDSLVNFFRSKYTFEIFLNDDVSLEQSTVITRDLQSNTAIYSVVLIDKEKSADIFLEEFGENVVDMLGYNPLPMSLKVSLEKNNFDLNRIEGLINDIENYNFVDSVEYRGAYIDNIEDKINLFIFFFLILVIGIVFISIQMISNTVKLSMSNRSDFIEILQYNGASDIFIKIPFFIESILQSIIGSFIAFLLVNYSFIVINSYFNLNIGIDNFLWAWMIGLSLIIGLYASNKAMKKILI
jgi:cell division transport system permease protein